MPRREAPGLAEGYAAFRTSYPVPNSRKLAEAKQASTPYELALIELHGFWTERGPETLLDTALARAAAERALGAFPADIQAEVEVYYHILLCEMAQVAAV